MPVIQALLSDYDLVGLQEDFDEAGHAALTEGTPHAEVRWFSAPFDAQRVYGSGLSLLLPQPASDYQEEHYAECNGVIDGSSDCLASKGFQTATLMLGGEPLHVLNTHHEAGGGEADEAARRTQVEQVVTTVESYAEDHAFLMTGDFNLRPSDPADEAPLARYDGADLLRACDLVDCPEPDHIDQIRVRSSTTLTLDVLEWTRAEQFVSDTGVDLSDHPAVSAVIAWEVVAD
jgi:endonuclease/exonuclease/phosphatase family metal-dependent hydrolase